MKFLVQALNLPLMLIYALSLIVPKNKNLILVGEWGGDLKEDNAVCLGKLLNSHRQFRVVFISNGHPDEASKIIKAHSLKSYWLHLRAAIFIVGSGKKDVVYPFVTSRSLLINAWHGLPIKKIHKMVKSNSISVRIRDALMPFYDETPDYIISTSAFASIMEDAFHPRVGVIKMPQPRWIRGENPCYKEEKVFLYSPTFRDNNRGFFPLSEEELLIIDDYLLKKNLPSLLITLHPVCTYFNNNLYKKVKFINLREINVYKHIFPNTVCVISDISSVLIEASYFSIPTYIYFPDMDDYISNSRDIISSVFDKYCVNKRDEFLQIIDESMSLKYEYKHFVTDDFSSYLTSVCKLIEEI